MRHGAIRQRMTRTSLALLMTVTATTLINLGMASSASASVNSNCHWNSNGDSTWGYSQILTHYPVTLHGTTVRLYSDKVNASVYATAANVSVGDVLSIDRSNFAVSGTAEHYWKQTSWIMAQSPNSGYDYCQWTATKSGFMTTFSPSWVIDGAHRYIRLCLRHSGSLQCSSWWYGDNDDNWNSVVP